MAAMLGKARGKISLIWFKDDEPVKRIRVHPVWLRVITYLGVVVVLAASGGMFLGYEFWRKSQDNAQERREVEKRLSEAMLKLERLQNIERILQNSDPTELKELLAGMGVELPGGKQSGTPGAPAKNQAKAAQTQRGPEKDKPALDLVEVMGLTDSGQVEVENFHVKFESKSVQVSFDLNSLTPQSSLNGSGQLFVVTRDAALYPLETPKEDLSFQIQRFKQITIQAPMPASIERKDVFGLRLIINSAGKNIYSETYPLAQAQ